MAPPHRNNSALQTMRRIPRGGKFFASDVLIGSRVDASAHPGGTMLKLILALTFVLGIYGLAVLLLPPILRLRQQRRR